MVVSPPGVVVGGNDRVVVVMRGPQSPVVVISGGRMDVVVVVDVFPGGVGRLNGGSFSP